MKILFLIIIAVTFCQHEYQFHKIKVTSSYNFTKPIDQNIFDDYEYYTFLQLIFENFHDLRSIDAIFAPFIKKYNFHILEDASRLSPRFGNIQYHKYIKLLIESGQHDIACQYLGRVPFRVEYLYEFMELAMKFRYNTKVIKCIASRMY